MGMRTLGEMTVADYVVAVEGLAMARNILTGPEVMAARSKEIAGLLAMADTELLAAGIAVHEYDVESGYSIWAERYDGPNPAIEAEAPLVLDLVGRLTPGRALDAACGTGRHAATLHGLGWDVIGVDATEAMLAKAAAKVPAGDFRQGRLEALPIEDDAVDLVVCALALTHVPDLAPVFAELARVLRPGGRLVTTDLHPFVTGTGLMAGFPVADRDEAAATPQAVHFVPNLTHHTSSYVEAIVGAGLAITACHEPRITEDQLDLFPTHALLPDATRQAFAGLPLLLVWEAVKPGA